MPTYDIPSFQTFFDGEMTTVRKKLNDNFDQAEAQIQGVEDRLEESLESLETDGVINGLLVSAGTGLSVNLSAGSALIGFVVDVEAKSDEAANGITDNTTNYCFLLQDGDLYFNTTGSPPTSQASILLAEVVASAGAITSVDNYANDVLRGIGQKHIRKATCTATEQVRDVVYASADGTVAQAIADDANPDTAKIVGVIIAKESDTSCLVATDGAVVGGFSSLTVGTVYYLSNTTAGSIISSKPASPDPAVSVGIAISTTQLQIKTFLDENAISGGGGAPTDASYVTISSEASLTNETLHSNITNQADIHPPKDHTHESASGQGAQLDHGAALTGLEDDDHTIYLKADGTRQLTGDLSADAGVRIDGVDISAHDSSGTGIHGASGGRLIGVKFGSDQDIFSGSGTQGPALANKGTSEYAAREDHEHSEGGEVAAHRASHETGGSDLVRFANLEHSASDTSTHDNYRAGPHIGSDWRDDITRPRGNLLADPSFENAESIFVPTGGDQPIWTEKKGGSGLSPERVNSTITAPKDGQYSLKLELGTLTAETDESGVYQVPIHVNTDYLYAFEVWLKSAAGTETAAVRALCYDAAGTYLGMRALAASAVIGTSWERKTNYLYGEGTGDNQFYADTKYIRYEIIQTEDGGAGTIYVDDARIYRIELQDVKKILSVEPAGEAWVADGTTNNFGTESDSGALGKRNTTDHWNYVQVKNNAGDATADIDIYIDFQVPYDLLSMTDFKFNERVNDATGNTKLQAVKILDTGGNAITVSEGAFPHDWNDTTWTEKTLTPTSGTWTPGETLTLHLKVFADDADNVDIGPITINYKRRLDK